MGAGFISRVLTVFAAAVLTIGLALPPAAFAKPQGTTSFYPFRTTTVQKMSAGRFNFRTALGITGTYTCRCEGEKAKGTCSLEQTEGTLACGVDGDSCTGTCSMSTTTGGTAIAR